MQTLQNYINPTHLFQSQLYKEGTPLEKELTSITKKIILLFEEYEKDTLLKKTGNLVPIYFDFTITAVQLVAKQTTISQMQNEIERDFEQMEAELTNPKLEVLISNLLFALRTKKRVFSHILTTQNENQILNQNSNLNNITQEKMLDQVAKETITFSSLISHLAFMPNEFSQNYIDWLSASVRIEIVFLIVTMVKKGELNLSDTIIDELASLVAHQSQLYYALSIQLEFIKKRKSNYKTIDFDEKTIEEQKQLADLGLNDLNKLIY